MLGSLFAFYQKYFSIIFIFTIVLLVAFAWSQRFIQDDAFISFRYAQNFINGEGLVWNTNERVEGYTNFLWTMLMSAGMICEMNPITCSYFFGLLFFAISLIVTYKTARLLFKSHDSAFLIMLFLGLNYTFLAFATGGLETQMQTAFLVSCFYLTIKIMNIPQVGVINYLYLSIVLSLAVLIRLDSGIIVVPIVIFTVIKIYSQDSSTALKFKRIVTLFIPMALIIGTWFIWKLSYYGNILPNTFYVKASAITSPIKGLKYVSTFFFSYLLFPLAVISIFSGREIFKHRISPFILINSVIGLWIIYLIKIGGDFMEFRFFVPILPFIFLLFGWTIFVFIKNRVYQWALALLIISGSVHHALTFALDPDERIEPIQNLHNHLFAQDENWSGIGKSLRHYFNHIKNVTIGVTAAGAIPYYSGLPSIDMYGLNDHYLAREGFLIGDTPGHQRMSPFNYLIKRGVNLIIAHPMVMKRTDEVKHFPILPSSPNDKYFTIKVLEIPIDSLYKFLTLYLTPNSAVDSVIEQNNWKVHLITKK
ncbi:MAG: hypothetical protein C0417_11225 [Chlorobiaceae bacterium]|nr:hypothetical protein [Chlorobiaceae bacterium]